MAPLGLQQALRPVSLRIRPLVARRARVATATRCEVRSAKGKRLDPSAVTVKSPIGEGSFGQVFQGTLAAGSGRESRVILKRVKDRVQGAQEMAEMEHLLNVYAAGACRRSVAPFVGYLEVPEPQGRLTKGLWLCWRYEGQNTLAYYLRRRDCAAALAADLGCAEGEVVPTVMAQLFECLVEFHNAGLVHRDVKPANLVLCEAERRFKLIDLGAAADLRTGTNYKPQETILDPLYAAPEDYVLPTDAPHLSQKAAPVALLTSAAMWQQHRPDCFDSWSAGVVLLQLGLPFLRAPSALKNWKATFARCGYDLEEWKLRSGLSARQTAALDADDGLGWDLAAGLLRPREVEADGRRGVRFVNTGAAPRLTPAAALKHPFLKKAAGRGAAGSGLGMSLSGLGSLFSGGSGDGSGDDDAAAATSRSGSTKQRRGGTGSGSTGSTGSSGIGKGKAILEAEGAGAKRGSGAGGASTGRLSSTWNFMKAKLFDLEARLAEQASDTQTQTTVVQALRRDVAEGRAAPETLAAEEGRLRSMQAGLQATAQELNSFFGKARGYLSSMNASGAGAKAEAAPPPPPAPAAAPAPEGAGVGKAVAEAATNAIYSGLKLTGGLLNAVSDLAAAAERGVSRAQAEAAARRAASAAFIEALQAARPPVTADSKWADVAPTLVDPGNFAALTPGQRRQAFDVYVEALQRQRQRAAAAAAADFAALLDEAAPGADATYDAFAGGPAGRDPRFVAVASETERRAAFEAAVARRRAAEQRAAAKAEAAAAARAEAEAAAAAQAQAAADAAAAAAAAGAEAPAPAAPGKPAPSAAEAERLTFLVAEQARLKEEYARMEAKLVEMEKALAVQNLVGSLLEEGAVVEADAEGAVTFRFAAAAEEAPAVNASGAKAKE